MKHVDLVEPTTYLDHVYLGCTQRECQVQPDATSDKFIPMPQAMISCIVAIQIG